MPNKAHLLIADIQPIVITGLQSLLKRYLPDLTSKAVLTVKDMHLSLGRGGFTHLIMDMASTGSLRLLSRLKKQYPSLQILVYSMAPRELYSRTLVQAGATVFLSKTAGEKQIRQALHQFLGKERKRKQEAKKPLQKNTELQFHRAFFMLSPNERRVLARLLKGDGVTTMANYFGVRLQTIASYKNRIFTKLGTKNLFDIKSMIELNGLQIAG